MYENNLIKRVSYKFFDLLPDKLFIQLKFFKNFHRFPNLKNPQTFSEKIQWLKLYDRNPRYTNLVDKYEVKKIVADLIGEQYIIPTLGVWNNADEIDYDALPNQFVLKATHDSGRIIICKDKSKLDKEWARKEMAKSLERDFYALTREWPYKNVHRRIIAELYMENPQDPGRDLSDYKFFCFDGIPHYCQVIRNRSSKETIDFYDMQWNHMPFVGLNPVVSNGLNPVERPTCLDEMVDVCTKLSKGFAFSRVDLYVIDDKVYFGEITFYPASGMGVFTPVEWNIKLGDLIKLPIEE
ncbi:MAG: hypothetical protein E7091_06060 [Bacteroidales bacterium]|nr:hypothetical protein [Bacteroidales bacterium]